MLKRCLQVLVVLLAVGLGLAVSLPWVVAYPPGRAVVVSLASRLIGYRVEVSSIELGSGWQLRLRDLRVSDTEGQAVFAARELDVDFPPTALLAGRVGIVRVSAFRIMPRRGVTRDGAGARFASLPRLPFDELRASDGELILADYAGLSIGLAEIRVRPGLRGQGVVANLELSAEGEPLRQRVELSASLLLGVDADRAELDCDLKLAPLVSPVRLQGTLYGVASGRIPRLDLSLGWADESLGNVAAVFFDDPQLKRLAGSVELEARLRGELASPKVSATLSLTGFELSVGSMSFAGNAHLPVHYEDGELSGGALTLSDLRLAYADVEMKVVRVAASATLEVPAELPRLRLEHLVLEGIDGHDRDYSRVVQGLSLDGRLSLVTSERGQEFSLELKSASGELLWHSFYLDLKEFGSALTIDGVVGRGGLLIERGELDLAGIGRLEGRAELGSGARLSSAKLSFTIASLERAYRLFVAQALEAQHPSLAAVSLAGRASGRLRAMLASGGGLLLDGHISLDANELVAAGGRLRLHDLALRLPVKIGGRAGGDGHAESVAGSIAVGGGKLAELELPRLQIPLHIDRDRIEAAGALAFELAEGRVRIGSLGLYQLSGSRRRLSAAFEAEELDAAMLLAAAGLPVFNGTVSAEFPAIEVSGSAVESHGEVTAGLFGGQIIGRDFRLEQLDTPVPALFMDVEARAIDLARVTAATSLGEISGRASAAIAGLEIVAGEPVAFDAWVKTVPARGVSQRISVTALEQLQILGGAGANPLTSGLLSFFDAYRYATMGFSCSLRNDRFVLEGVQSKQGRDYLVVGSLLPPTVNVISHNQVIGFSQMVERLARIAEVGGPVAARDEGLR